MVMKEGRAIDNEEERREVREVDDGGRWEGVTKWREVMGDES